MASERELELARHVLPGHGFFGFEQPMHLHVPVAGHVDCIRIGIESRAREILNLGAIMLIGPSGAPLRLEKHLSSACLSTPYKDDLPREILDGVIERKPIHSGVERLPTLTLEFERATELKGVVIVNRPGHWGCRSRDLTVHAWHGSDQVLSFRNGGEAELLERFTALMTRLGSTRADIAGTATDVEATARTIRRRIADGLVSGCLDWSCETLYPLLPVYDPDGTVDEDTRRLLGEIIARLVQVKGTLPTARLKDLKDLMASPAEIDSVRGHASAALRRRSGDERELVFSKHTIGYAALSAHEDQYLSAIKCVHRQLQEWSIPSMICYGTLLGAVRDGGFIEHDDDVDMLIIDGSASRDAMLANASALIERFRSAGFKAWDVGLNFHVVPPEHTVSVDLFPSWQEGDDTWVMMERGRYRHVSSGSLLPSASVELGDCRLPAPRDPEVFLADRYGPSWRVVDPYHEWPWPVETPDEAPGEPLDEARAA